jgi:hypothetical protein
MHPLQVSAQFAAYTWFSRTHPDLSGDEAARFSRSNWDDFLPVAQVGLGQLLLRIAGQGMTRSADVQAASSK